MYPLATYLTCRVLAQANTQSEREVAERRTFVSISLAPHLNLTHCRLGRVLSLSMSPDLPAPSTKFESEDGQQPHEPRNQPKKRRKRCKATREQDGTTDANVERITARSKKVRRGRGKLSGMMDMPVDIFPEVKQAN